LTERDATPARWKWWIPAVSAFAAHALALRNGFVLDDATLLVANPYVRTAAGLKTMLGSSLFAASRDPVRTDYYRPLASLLNWVSWQVFHDHRAGQHGLNVAMHAAVATLLAATLKRHGVRPGIALATATLFAVHPATAEIVAYTGGRQDMLGWLFVLGALYFLPGAESLARCATLVGAAMILGTFSHESFLAIVALMPLAAGFRVDDGSFDRRRALAAAGGMTLGLAVVAAARSAVGVRWSQPLEPHAATVWLGTGVALAGRMLKDLLAPTDLVVDLTLDRPPLAVSVLAIAGALAAVPLLFRALRGTSRPRVGIALLGLLVMLASVAVHTPIALRYDVCDRYAYPFILGAALLLAPLAQLAAEALAPHLSSSPLRKLLPVAPWAFAAVLVPATWARSVAWRSEESLQKQMYEDRPDDPQSKLAEGMRLLSIGDLKGALPLCEEYQLRYPALTRADWCLAQCYLGLGNTQLAIAPLQRYTAEHQADEGARFALERALFETNDIAGVERTLDQWGPDLAGQPDVIAARREVARRRKAAPPP